MKKKQFVQLEEFGTAPENMSCHSKKRYSFKGFFFVFVRGIFKRSHLVQSFFQWFVFIDDLNLESLKGATTQAGGVLYIQQILSSKTRNGGTKRLVKRKNVLFGQRLGTLFTYYKDKHQTELLLSAKSKRSKGNLRSSKFLLCRWESTAY